MGIQSKRLLSHNARNAVATVFEVALNASPPEDTCPISELYNTIQALPGITNEPSYHPLRP